MLHTAFLLFFLLFAQYDIFQLDALLRQTEKIQEERERKAEAERKRQVENEFFSSINALDKAIHVYATALNKQPKSQPVELAAFREAVKRMYKASKEYGQK